MLKVHLSDGRTLTFDLHSQEQAAEWLAKVKTHKFQEEIRAVVLHVSGHQYILTKPVDLSPVFFNAEVFDWKGKEVETAICISGEIAVKLTSHSNQKALRIAISREGKQRFNPLRQE